MPRFLERLHNTKSASCFRQTIEMSSAKVRVKDKNLQHFILKSRQGFVGDVENKPEPSQEARSKAAMEMWNGCSTSRWV